MIRDSVPVVVLEDAATLRSFSALYSHIYRNHRDAGITGSRGIEQLFQSSSDCTTSDPHSSWTNVSSWNLNPVYLVSDTYSLLIT